MKDIFLKFLYLFDKKEKRKLGAMLVLILFGAFLEMSVVGIIYPYISILKSPEIIQEHKILNLIYSFFGMESHKEFIIMATIGIIVIYLIKNSYSIFLAYVQSRFTYNKQMLFSRRLLTFYLRQPYTFHLQRNSAELSHKINVVIPSLFSGFLLSALTFVVEVTIAISIFCLLVTVKPLLSIVTVAALGSVSFIFYRKIREKISKFGKLRQNYGEKMFLWVNQGLGSIKETKVLGREDFFINAYNNNSIGRARIERFVYMINQLPRPFLETISIVGMLSITLLMISRNNDFSSVIPTLSLFAMAAFRLIPSMNRIFASLTGIRYNAYAVETIYNDLIQSGSSANFFENEGNRANPDVDRKFDGRTFLNKSIELNDVCYSYPNASKPALTNISLTIPANSTVGFVGATGAGKTTLIDVILGLLPPTQGEVLVNDENIEKDLPKWQRQIGYIPQHIYLSDDTILRNVAFGLADDEIDEERAWSALRSAQLSGFVEGLPDKLHTIIGERGVRLSGGQRQRIGIARALYHNPAVLVMDEGTASLDNETEWQIMKTVGNLSQKTIIIIAHRLSTVKNCDRLYFFKDGRLVTDGTYNDLLSKNGEFKTMAMAVEA